MPTSCNISEIYFGTSYADCLLADSQHNYYDKYQLLRIQY